LFLLGPVAFLAGCGGARAPDPGGPGQAADADHAAAHGGAPVKGAAAAPARPNEVVIDNFTFSPRRLTVKAGTKVTWVNRDDLPHTATSTARPRRFDSGTLDTDDRFVHVFAAPGTYEYFCALHPKMTGQIIVK
jgi:plastocyanin